MTKIRKQLNQTSMSLIALLYVALAALAWSCSQSDVTPLSAPSPVVETFNTPAPPPSTPNAGVQSGDEQTQCDLINITARRVLSVSPTSVTLRVTASYEGNETPYVRIIDKSSGVKLGDYPLGDITLQVGPGHYEWFVFVEVSHGGRTIQCDGSVVFDVPREEECQPKITESEEVEYSEWGECTPDQEPTLSEGYWGTQTRVRTTTFFETNSCTGKTEEVGEKEEKEKQRCELKCGDVHPPSIGEPSSEIGFLDLEVSQPVHNEGTWKGIIYAGSPNNPRRYEKDADTDRVDCGESDTLKTKYRYRTHSSCLWTYAWFLNDVELGSYVVLNRCD